MYTHNGHSTFKDIMKISVEEMKKELSIKVLSFIFNYFFKICFMYISSEKTHDYGS